MIWNNYGLISSKNKDAQHFTSDFGITLRKKMLGVMKLIIRSNLGLETIIVSYPKLNKNESYIFTAGHSFPGEIVTNLFAIDRNVYTLVGTTDQVDHNPQMYFLWLNGLIYVNKLDNASRQEAYKKMKRILNHGSSVLMFPEGVLNNSENLNCVTVYPGFYHLACESNKKIVPIVSNYNYDEKYILVAAAEPIDLTVYSKYEAMDLLRDVIATLRFDLSRMTLSEARNINRVLTPDEFYHLNPNISVELYREELQGDIHLQYMEQRKKIYDEVHWTNPNCFDEEIMSYNDKRYTSFEEAFSFVDDIVLADKNVAVSSIISPILARRKEINKYDFKQYMKDNWHK